MKRTLLAVFLLVFGVSVLAWGQEYLVGPGDILYIAVWGDESLTGLVTISPDGEITLPSPLGVMEVRGLTVKEVEKLLTDQLSKYVKSPRVTVSLTEKGYRIHVIGEVRAPSFYKVPENTTLQELLTRAGGLTEYADTKRISITSQNEDSSTSIQEIDFFKFLRGNDIGANPVLKPNDVIFVPRISTEEYFSKMITVLGSVQSPGSFEFEEETALVDVITMAGGFTPDAVLDEVQIIDLNSQDAGGQMVNVKKFLTERDPSGNPMVQTRTIIYVPSTYVPPELTVPINLVGQILKPGTYRMRAEKCRLADAIFTAGGFAEGANMEEVKILRRNSLDEKVEYNLKDFLVAGNMDQNPVLHEGDTVVVPISERVKQISLIDTAFVPYKEVSVIGEVRTPGTYQVPTSATLLDVLILGGGTTSGADIERVTMIRETGRETKFQIDLRKVLTEGRFELLPKLESGDTIFVPQQKESKWRQTVRLAGELSTVAMLVLLVTRVATGTGY